MLNNVTWDKELTFKLLRLGFTREEAGIVVGEVAEHRQIADREGYIRGYNSGYEDAKKKYEKEKS